MLVKRTLDVCVSSIIDHIGGMVSTILDVYNLSRNKIFFKYLCPFWLPQNSNPRHALRYKELQSAKTSSSTTYRTYGNTRRLK